MEVKKNIGMLCVILSGIYITVLPIGLPHIMFLFAFFQYIIYIFNRKVLQDGIVILILLSFLFLIQVLIGGDVKAIINQVSSMLMLYLIVEFLRNRSLNEIKQISIYFIKITTNILIIECCIRYVLGTLWPKSADFYNYKFYSFMFQDTNFAALLILSLYFFLKYLKIFEGIVLKKYARILFVLCFLTLSRAAILALLFSEILFYKIDNKHYRRQIFIRIIILSIGLFVVGTILYQFFMADGSFRSKLLILDIYENTKDNLQQYFYLGTGLNISKQILEIYPHNVLLLYFLEIGMIGLLFKALLIFYVMIKSKWKAILIFLPFFIAAQSAVGYGVHYLYVIFGLIILFQMKKQDYISNDSCLENI